MAPYRYSRGGLRNLPPVFQSSFNPSLSVSLPPSLLLPFGALFGRLCTIYSFTLQPLRAARDLMTGKFSNLFKSSGDKEAKEEPKPDEKLASSIPAVFSTKAYFGEKDKPLAQ